MENNINDEFSKRLRECNLHLEKQIMVAIRNYLTDTTFILTSKTAESVSLTSEDISGILQYSEFTLDQAKGLLEQMLPLLLHGTKFEPTQTL